MGDPFFVSTGAIITVHVLEFCYILIAIGLYFFTKSLFGRAKEFIATRHRDAILYFILLMHALVVGIVRMSVFLTEKYQNIWFRMTMIGYTVVIVLTLLLFKLKTLILLAPILVFDIVMFACLPFFKVANKSENYYNNMRFEKLDVFRLFVKVATYSGEKRFINITGLLGKIQDEARKCATTSVEPFDFDTVVTYFATDESNPSTAGIAQFAMFLDTQYNESSYMSKTSGMPSCNVPFGIFIEDTKQFLGRWDGIVSANYTKLNVFKLLGAITNLKNVDGYGFLDMFVLLKRLNKATEEIDDYASFVNGLGIKSANSHSAPIGGFQEYISKVVVTRTATLTEITQKLVDSLKCTTKCDKMPKPLISGVSINVFDLADAVTMVATDDGYLKYIDIAALITNLQDVYVSRGSTPLGSAAMHKLLCPGVGKQAHTAATDVSILNAREHIIDVVLTGQAEMPVRDFIKIALVFVLHTDEKIKEDRTYTSFYTSGDVLKALRPVEENVEMSILNKKTLSYNLQFANGSSKADSVVFYYTDDVDLNEQTSVFEQDKKLKESVIVFAWK